MPTNISCSEVSLCTYDNDITKSWFVYFDITDQNLGLTTRKQFRGGINYYHTVDERLRFGRELVKFWQEKLRSGWSPFEDDSVDGLNAMKFNAALDWALDRCVVSRKTKSGYAGTVRFFQKASKKAGLDNAYIGGITKQHILLMLDIIKKERKWSNKAYNKHASYICGVISKLVKYMVIEKNPAEKIDPLPVAESDKYTTFTPEEKKLLKDVIGTGHPAFYTFLMLVYHTGIRPKEALSLKVEDIYLDKNMIKIIPDLQEENSKTKSIRWITLNKHMQSMLVNHLANADINDYVFGRPVKGSVGKRNGKEMTILDARRADYFRPSSLPIKRDTATKLYKRIVWNDLGIHKYLYALKHTGADDKILAGLPLDALKTLFGHSSKLMTEKYAKKVKQVYAAQIINDSPEF